MQLQFDKFIARFGAKLARRLPVEVTPNKHFASMLFLVLVVFAAFPAIKSPVTLGVAHGVQKVLLDNLNVELIIDKSYDGNVTDFNSDYLPTNVTVVKGMSGVVGTDYTTEAVSAGNSSDGPGNVTVKVNRKWSWYDIRMMIGIAMGIFVTTVLACCCVLSCVISCCLSDKDERSTQQSIRSTNAPTSRPVISTVSAPQPTWLQPKPRIQPPKEAMPSTSEQTNPESSPVLAQPPAPTERRLSMFTVRSTHHELQTVTGRNVLNRTLVRVAEVMRVPRFRRRRCVYDV